MFLRSGGRLSLTDEQAKKIGRIGLEVDRAFGCRVDLEWAMEGEEIFLVQARPVTALPHFFPHDLEGEEAKLSWTLTDPDPVIPFFRDLWDSQAWVKYKPEGVALVDTYISRTHILLPARRL